jgi:O-antigen/teichoic acid export membrane protein
VKSADLKFGFWDKAPRFLRVCSIRKALISAQSVVKRATDGTRKKAVFYYASSSLVCQALRFLGVVVTMRTIGPEQFGLFAQATLLMSLAGLCREAGQSGALIAYQGADLRYVHFNFQMNFLLGLLTTTLVFASLLAPQLLPDDLRSYIWVVALIPFFESLTLTNTLMLQKCFRFKILGIAEIVSLVAWLAAILLTIGRTSGFLVLLFGQLAENLCRCVLLFAVGRFNFVGFSWGKDLTYYYFSRFAKPTIVWVVLQSLLMRLDLLLLTMFSSTRELGSYERLAQFTRIPVSLTVNLCDKVLVNAYSQDQNDQSALRKLFGRSMLVIAGAVVLATMAVSVGLLIFLRPLIGTDWAAIIMRLWWFSLPVTLMSPLYANLTLFFSGLGMQTQLLRNTALHLSIVLVVGSFFAGPFGAAGLLVANSIGTGLVLCYQLLKARAKLTGVP